MRRVLMLIVRGYQKTFSLDHGPLKFLRPEGFCRYYPSCSEYAVQALDRHGPLHGLILACKRVLRCHPWSTGGIDPVPERAAR